MTYGTYRTGTGRWTPVRRPSVGVLWTNDADCLAFFQSNLDIDPTPVQALIDTADAAGLSATTAFDQLAAAIGSRVDVGDLDDWRPTRTSRARRAPGALPEPRG